MTLQQFQDQYKSTLAILKSQKEEEMAQHTSAQRHDEGKFAKIELNIIDIFEKMFIASLGKVKSDPWQEPLKEAYLAFFEKLPTPWRQNLLKAEQFNSHEEAHIERLKIAQAEAIKETFLDMLKQA